MAALGGGHLHILVICITSETFDAFLCRLLHSMLHVAILAQSLWAKMAFVFVKYTWNMEIERLAYAMESIEFRYGF